VAWVTGAANGIGRRLVSDLLARGHRVAASDIAAEGLDDAATADEWPEDRVERIPLDVRSPEQWASGLARIEARWGCPNVLLNVAGVLKPARLLDATVEDYDLHFDVNVKGVVLGTRTAARAMVENGGGHIINIGSLSGCVPIPGYTFYSPSKAAVRFFSLLLAEELAPRGVDVTVVSPDVVKTAMYDINLANADVVGASLTSKRFLETEEVSRIIVDEVMVDRPLERAIPKSRGLLVNLVDAFPAVAKRMLHYLSEKGRKRAGSLNALGK
jgi:3-oxoacyl-[acyl-carrier protein] reductase